MVILDKVKQLIGKHPSPWQIGYWRRCEEWHPKSNPFICDCNGSKVLQMPQSVGHPGEYDEQADALAHLIVAAVNSLDLKETP